MSYYLFPDYPPRPSEATVAVAHFFVPYRLVWSSWFEWWAEHDAKP